MSAIMLSRNSVIEVILRSSYPRHPSRPSKRYPRSPHRARLDPHRARLAPTTAKPFSPTGFMPTPPKYAEWAPFPRDPQRLVGDRLGIVCHLPPLSTAEDR